MPAMASLLRSTAVQSIHPLPKKGAHRAPKIASTERFYLYQNLLLFSIGCLLGLFLWHGCGARCTPYSTALLLFYLP